MKRVFTFTCSSQLRTLWQVNSAPLSLRINSLGSSSGTWRCRRWVERGWPITWQARRSETRFDPSVLRTCSTASRRLPGLSSFPKWLPSGSSCPMPDQQPASSVARSHVLNLSSAWLDRCASHPIRDATCNTSVPISQASDRPGQVFDPSMFPLRQSEVSI